MARRSDAIFQETGGQEVLEYSCCNRVSAGIAHLFGKKAQTERMFSGTWNIRPKEGGIKRFQSKGPHFVKNCQQAHAENTSALKTKPWFDGPRLRLKLSCGGRGLFALLDADALRAFVSKESQSWQAFHHRRRRSKST